MDLASRPTEVADRARAFVLHTIALFLAMCLSYLLLDGTTGPIGAAAVLWLYVLATTFRRDPQRSDRAKALLGPRGWSVFLLFHASGFMTVTGATAVVVVCWLSVAYTPFKIEDMGVSPADIGGGLPHALTLLAGGIVLLALGVLLLNWGKGGLGRLFARLRQHGLGLILAPFLHETSLLLLLTGGLGLFVASVPLAILVDAMSFGRAHGFPAVVEQFPFLALGLVALAVLAAASADLTRNYALFEDMVQVLRTDDELPPRRDPWLVGLGPITLGGGAAITGALLWGLHVGFVAAGASAPALLAAQATAGALNDRALGFQTASQPGDFAATVNAHGFWRPDAPEAGLAVFLPGFQDSVEVAGKLSPGCQIIVAAAPATAEDAVRPMPDLPDWNTLPLDSPNYGASGDGNDAEMRSYSARELSPQPPLRYCVRVTCPVPVTWNAEAAVALYSSHPSGRRDWLLNFYFDMFAVGRAPEPGGYCNADGSLADTYQG